MTRYKGRSSPKSVERSFPHRVETIVPEGGVWKAPGRNAQLAPCAEYYAKIRSSASRCEQLRLRDLMLCRCGDGEQFSPVIRPFVNCKARTAKSSGPRFGTFGRASARSLPARTPEVCHVADRTADTSISVLGSVCLVDCGQESGNSRHSTTIEPRSLT